MYIGFELQSTLFELQSNPKSVDPELPMTEYRYRIRSFLLFLLWGLLIG